MQGNSSLEKQQEIDPRRSLGNEAMDVQNQFSCFVIGEGTLLIQCAEVLLERDHNIKGVISSDASVSHWAKAKDIPSIQPIDNLVAFLSQQPFDYLFSIVNHSVLPKEILELPRQLAINYHDAILPRYAGVNATSWALMHGEKTYGITWHVMTVLVDSGDILKQFSIDIASDETSFTLKGKCYEAAIRSFAELIDDLSSSQALVSKQNLDERTYFPRYKKPRAGGVLSFNRCAHDIDAFVRALDFGPYPNPLGLAKLVIGNNSIIVSKLEVLSDQPKSPPGTVTAIEPSFLKVSTASYSVALHQMLTVSGQALSIPDLVARFGLQVGYQFKDIEPDRVRRIERFDALIAKHEAFWVERLTTLQPITISYAQRTASHLKSKQYASVEIPVSQEVTTFLEKRHSAWNRGDFLEAAFVAYLARIGGTGCFDIGFRDVKLQQEMVGLESLFASHVPCRVDIEYEQSFEEVFEAFRKQVELTKLHLTYARDVVRRYPALHSLSQTDCEPMFPVVVERVEKLDGYQAGSGNELSLVIPSDGKECFWFYNIEALDGDSIARMQDQFTIFLRGIVTDPARCVAYLPLLSEQELHKIQVEWNNTQIDFPDYKCIHQLFEAQVERTPDSVAVVFEQEQLTYRQLNARANKLAHYLQKLGVKPEVLVGLCVERSLEMIVGLLGILKAGGAYVPVDPSYPTERNAFLLEDAQVSVLLTQAPLVESLPEHQAQVICLDKDWEMIALEKENNPHSRATLKNLIYVIFTSGSTGRPKGVAVEHQQLLNYLCGIQEKLQLPKEGNFALASTLAADLGNTIIFPCLCTGGCLHVLSLERVSNPNAFNDYCLEYPIDCLKIVPSHLAALLTSSHPEAILPRQRLILGGEATSWDLIEQIQQYAPACQIFNHYGPTEATIGVLTYTVQSQPTDEPIPTVPLGRPLPNTQIYLLDRHLQPVPVGVRGEVYIGGAGLARGYLNQPELTTEQFIANPLGEISSFASFPNSRLYKTGDLARYRADGNIEYLGRIDNQVKIRGFRIELSEIEAVLTQHPGVEQAVAIVREDVPGDKRLVAYIMNKPQQAATTVELSHFLKQKLPDYMIPSAWVELDQLPLTPNGKIDRRALPTPSPTRTTAETFVPPRTPIEEIVANIWTKILNVEPINIHDNFFKLGGHSLKLIQVVSRIRQSLGVDLPLAEFFESATVAKLAERIQRIQLIVKLQASPLEMLDNREEVEL